MTLKIASEWASVIRVDANYLSDYLKFILLSNRIRIHTMGVEITPI